MRTPILIAATASLAACTNAMPAYQAAGGPNSVGHFAAPAAEGRHVVGYTGSKEMSAAQVAEFAMLRAAELTTASGHEWFAVIQTATRKVEAGDINNIQGRTGPILSSETITATAGASSDRSSSPVGVADGTVTMGPSTGGFGGGDVPYQVLERWIPPAVHQTTIVIQMGSGRNASFEGLEKVPEIFSAKSVTEGVRAKMAK